MKALLASFVVLLALIGVLLLTPASESVDCAALESPEERAACKSGVGGADDGAMRADIAVGGTAWERDLLRLEQVRNDPRLAQTLCPEIEGEEARVLCLRVEGRSHLWRGEGGTGSGRGEGSGRERRKER